MYVHSTYRCENHLLISSPSPVPELFENTFIPLRLRVVPITIQAATIFRIEVCGVAFHRQYRLEPRVAALLQPRKQILQSSGY
jgi:hypothetical protein